MDWVFYSFASTLIIMIWHFAFSTKPRDFGLMQMIGVFIVGAAFGFYLNSTETALLISIVLSLIFI